MVGVAAALLPVPATVGVGCLAKPAGLSDGVSLSEVFGLATVVSATFGASTGFAFSAVFFVFSAGAVAVGCSVLASVPFDWSLVAEAAGVSSFLGSFTGLEVSFCFAFTSSVAIS